MNIRDELISEVKKYFVGPRELDEILPPIPNYPIDYYNSGILFPHNAEQDALDTEDFETDGIKDQETQDLAKQSVPQTKQSTIGLRVDIKDGVKSVNVEVNYAKYENIEAGWKRIPLLENKKNHIINLNDDQGSLYIDDKNEEHEVKLSWMIDEGTETLKYRVLNIFLENYKEWKEYIKGKGESFNEVRIENNHRTIFQPTIKIHSEKPIFRSHKSVNNMGMRTSEDQSLELIFRDTFVFGEGSNCSAIWDDRPDPMWVKTEFIPTCTLPAIGKESENPHDGRPEKIDLHSLSYADKDNDSDYMKQFDKKIRPIINGYKDWIDHSKSKISTLDEGNKSKYIPAAKNNMEQCIQAWKRMNEGLEFLLKPDNKKIRLAFALANRAMLYQRLHYEYSLKRSKGETTHTKPDPARPGQAFWYPFQLAFFIMNIRGISDKLSPERSIVDLLWFPTGGGKTEAYLAVAAFAMINRRMNGGDNEGLGVSIIMRYTLRLLTLQQFERASSLICALEFFRRNNRDYGLGGEPFLIGLWVGYSLTPSSYKDSDDALRKLRSRSGSVTKNSPIQSIYCPWCGEKIGPYNYAINNDNKWTVVHCQNKDCYFYSNDKTETDRALPILTVDFDIYRRCPSMIIATVDKFARMAYRSDISALFGKVERHCNRHGFLTHGVDCSVKTKHRDGKISKIKPLDGPDMIIQDELHLITGPLGSIVGLYETAVDFLSRRISNEKAIKPKIIVSTATIRGIDDQVRNLFDRKPPQKFPPPGIDKGDSFFWWESNRPGRTYVGVSFSHRSAKYSLAKLYAALLQKVQNLSKTLPQDKIDPYWTLVGYFNSIRELGSTIRLVEDDVVGNIKFITGSISECRSDEKRNPGKPHQGLEELTGRVTQDEIRAIREKLEKTVKDQDCINTLLATNMISVGIDIDRLGLMVVNGQTKNTSEYIQATGRIGRRSDVPGLIFTQYNPYKPRDLSHYENFMGHHSMLQKYVEPASITPFSLGSIERGIHAVLVAMIRLSIPRLSQKKSANNFEKSDADEILKFILNRIKNIYTVDESDASFRIAKRYMNAFIDEWGKFIDRVNDDADITGNKEVWYNNPYHPKEYLKVEENPNVLMIEFAKKTGDPDKFPKATPESLRNVEKEIGLRYY